MDEKLVRIVFRLEPSAWHGNATERLWAEPLGKDRFRLRNSPFYAFDVSNEDIVLGEQSDGEMFFKNVVMRGGHSTYRLKLRVQDVRAPGFTRFWQPLERRGCSFEEGPVVAVDVPPRADIYAVYGLLEAGESAGTWDFEEGHCGHPLDRRD
jgi:hypothetical protein